MNIDPVGLQTKVLLATGESSCAFNSAMIWADVVCLLLTFDMSLVMLCGLSQPTRFLHSVKIGHQAAQV